MSDDLITIVVCVVVVAVPIAYIIHSQAEARRHADRIIASKQRTSSREINRCITTLEKRGKSLLGFGRWRSEEDRYRVEKLRNIRDKAEPSGDPSS